jgi:trk system potassium uptake protein TrkH
LTERTSFLGVLFEVTSALGTVGLSMGLTPGLTAFGKIAISITMLAGRLGPLAVGFALVGRPQRVQFRYAEEKVFVG